MVQVREYWNIGTEPIKDLQYLLEKNGIIVTGFDTNEDKIDAFSQRTIVAGNDIYFIAVALGSRPKGRKSDTNFAITQKVVSMIIKKQRLNIIIVEKLIVTALLTQI